MSNAWNEGMKSMGKHVEFLDEASASAGAAALERSFEDRDVEVSQTTEVTA